MTYEFEARLWRWEARRTDSWTFVSLPPEVADEILELAAPYARGFGSLRVEVAIGRSVWRTSIFPDAKAATYVLPLKKAVRAAEGIEAGDTAVVNLTVLDLEAS